MGARKILDCQRFPVKLHCRYSHPEQVRPSPGSPLVIHTSATLLQRLRDHRDRAAWERLVHLYTPLIRGWLKRHLPQSADVDDLAQQVFAVVVEKLRHICVVSETAVAHVCS